MAAKMDPQLLQAQEIGEHDKPSTSAIKTKDFLLSFITNNICDKELLLEEDIAGYLEDEEVCGDAFKRHILQLGSQQGPAHTKGTEGRRRFWMRRRRWTTEGGRGRWEWEPSTGWSTPRRNDGALRSFDPRQEPRRRSQVGLPRQIGLTEANRWSRSHTWDWLYQLRILAVDKDELDGWKLYAPNFPRFINQSHLPAFKNVQTFYEKVKPEFAFGFHLVGLQRALYKYPVPMLNEEMYTLYDATPPTIEQFKTTFHKYLNGTAWLYSDDPSWHQIMRVICVTTEYVKDIYEAPSYSTSYDHTRLAEMIVNVVNWLVEFFEENWDEKIACKGGWRCVPEN